MRFTSEQQEEIQQQGQATAQTRRSTVPALEEILYHPYPVLDHGFIRVVDYMGGDDAVVQAARVSYGKGTRKISEDTGLIRYLMRHWHTTPFEMCEIKMHIKLPIFIARQWIRHRTANVNEYSGRYSIMDKEFYIPQPEHLAAQSHQNRQGRGAVLDESAAAEVLALLKDDAARCHHHYELMLQDEENGHGYGLARELARMNLTLNTYTQWYWKTDLHNFLHFLHLRMDSHAQFEIQAYAQVMFDILEKWVPVTAMAFKDYRLGAYTFSAGMLKVLKAMLAGQKIEQESSNLSKREWRELMDVLEAN
ncbi:FAD-dependent thymidylate synthase [Entomobacter blattae]|uniref:Flavin-dependent thymidylate synthase n=1 Tax=Entomobacter blattae TaxID=2762277 RepID=A0A7H1NR21_9PROT|nr:FAD-dependent thymidylate synthase [Entomobacter blattae]QNT78231.1 Thymidylate synthase ThyX [Entomobacter blattae]